MAFEGVLTRQKWADKWCATFWDPVPQDLVALNCEILNCHDFKHSRKVASWQNTSNLFLKSLLKPGASGWRSLRRKHILKNDIKKQTKNKQMHNLPNSSVFVKMVFFFIPFRGFLFLWPWKPQFMGRPQFIFTYWRPQFIKLLVNHGLLIFTYNTKDARPG